MRFLKSTAAGIVGSGMTALVIFAYRTYHAFQRPVDDVGFMDFYFPKWVPLWAANMWMDLRVWSRFHVAILSTSAAFVLSFCWEYCRVSMRGTASPR